MNKSQVYKISQWLFPVFILFLFRPFLLEQWEQTKAAYTRAKSMEKKIEQTGIHIRELSDLKIDFESLAKKKVEISSSLFDLAHQANLYELLLQKATETGVRLGSVSGRPVMPDNGFFLMPAKAEISGSFSDLAKFVHDVENMNRIISLPEITVSQDRSGALLASLEMVAYLYSGPEEKKPSKIGKPVLNPVDEKYVEKLKKALSISMAAGLQPFESFDKEPFGVVAPERNKTVSGTQAQKAPMALTLKGILWKDRPLAILETLDGKTWIAKKGDSNGDYTVADIQQYSVTISTAQGKQVLEQGKKK